MKLNRLKATQTVYYDPDAYLEFCEENNIEPTQEGFVEYIQDWIYTCFKVESCCFALKDFNVMPDIEEVK